MPYKTNSQLPKGAKKLSQSAQTRFRKTFNNAIKEYGDEGKAFATAYASAKGTTNKKKLK